MKKARAKMIRALLVGGLLAFALVGQAVAQTCIQPPAGLVSWWPGDGNADDIVGYHNYVLVGNPSALQLQDFTMDAWIKLSTLAAKPATRQAAEIPEVTKQQIFESYGKLPLSFEANQGQTDKQVKFLSRGSGLYSLFLTSTEAVLVLNKEGQGSGTRGQKTLDTHPHLTPEIAMLRMKLVGSNRKASVTGVDELGGKANYFIGNDPKKWRTNVSTYAKVAYKEIYPGANLIYYGNQKQLEYDFIVAAGADPKKIRLGFEGVDKMEVDDEGNLSLDVAGRPIRLPKPLVYQEIDGVRQEIAGAYVVKGKHQVGFQVGDYDASRPLVIDPVVLVYSTYLGGSSDDRGSHIALDSAGNAYVTGLTNSTNFPTTLGSETK